MSLAIMAQQCTLPSFWGQPSTGQQVEQRQTHHETFGEKVDESLQIIMHARGPILHADLCAETGRSYATMARICNHLVGDGRIKRYHDASGRVWVEAV